MNTNKHSVPFRFIIIFLMGLALISCSSTGADITFETSTPKAAGTVNPMFLNPLSQTSEDNPAETEALPEPEVEAEAEPASDISGIVIDLNNETKPISPLLLGTNVPAWLGSDRISNEVFVERTKASGVSLVRIPGGSWANYYEWLPCEMENICPWDWGALTPTDFINFINATGLEAMYIVNMNGTAKEAAALVAFFNGTVDDDTQIGIDGWGRDWGTVSDWAQLRTDHGNPEPIGIKYWEVGNETYAGKQGMGTDCNQSWGWEDVWTCDGTEYFTGIGEDDERKEGFIEYVDEMKSVDPTIGIGAVGVYPHEDWNNWGYEIITNADETLDFYSIHQYGFFDPPSNNEIILAQPQTVWGPMMVDLQDAFYRFGTGSAPPIAITEYNLFTAQSNDNDQLMTRAVNMLYLADTIGQMATHGYAVANQWNLANGVAENGTDYGILHADSFERYPQYYVFPLWSQFGTELLPVASSFPSETTLSTYASKHEDGSIAILAINKTDAPITSDIQILNAPESFTSGTMDVVQADSLDSQQVTWNGVENPADDLSDAPPTSLDTIENPTSLTFAPYSITLVRLMP